jgi:hypothetical protein
MPRPTRFDWLFRPQVADVDLPLSAEARFAEALAELPAVERSVLALSEIGGLDTYEIAERLGTDPAIVRKLLARARQSVRAALATRGRRGLTALLPVQSLWQVGSSMPTMRAAGLVAAAVVAPTVAIGGARADAPHATFIRPDAPVVRAIEQPHRGPYRTARAQIGLVRAVPAVVVTRGQAAAADRPRSTRLAAPTAPAQPPQHREQADERTPTPPPPAAQSETIARTLPLPVPAPLAPAPPPIELPVVPPTLPALPVPVPAPELPKPPLLP